jgi:type IV secretory pathway VirD2 relaxase
MHLKYIERDGVTPQGGAGHAYGRDVDRADTRQFAERCRDDRHQFRFIVSPEDAAQLKDLREFTRTLMQQMEKDFQTRLEWIAVDHWDTANPHTHVVLRGKDQHRRDLVIAREYISHGMRLRASELATEWLGLRTERELQESLTRDIDQERWTAIDRAIERQSENGVIDLRMRAEDARFDFERTLKLRRLHRLSTLGLARETNSGIWSVSADAEKILRSMGERGDIIRTMQRAFSKTRRDFSIVDPSTLKSPVIGRLAATGYADELNDRRYAIVDGVDGRAHYLQLSSGFDTTDYPIGSVVQIGAANAARTADQTIAKLAVSGIYRVEKHLDLARAGARPGRSPDALVAAHVRRLEALRRVGIVERIEDGVWRIPDNLVERGKLYDRQRVSAPDIKLITPLPIEKQTRALGVTWLDHQLIRDAPAPSSQGFGADTRNALQQRLAFLVEEELAERQGTRVTLNRNLLLNLQMRELNAVAKTIETQTGLTYRPTSDSDHVRGVYRRSVTSTTGRFAMLEEGTGFSLVPWRPVIEQHLGKEVRGIVSGRDVSWRFERTRGLSL